jgi:hypothetical protein
MALAVAVATFERERAFTSRVLFRAVETDLDAASAPRPNRQLRRHIERVVFSRAHLLPILRARGLYTSLLARDPELAVAAMRNQIEVEVWRNDLGTRTAGEAPPSAHIAVSFRAADPLLADAVAGDLAILMVDELSASRLQEAEATARQARRELDQLSIAGRPIALVGEMRAREQALAALDLRARLESSRLGLRFQVVDGGRPTSATRPRSPRGLGLLAFLALVPITALVMGALDRRIYDLSDLERLGLSAIGALSCTRSAR